MNISELIKKRLVQLGYEQRDLAEAMEVTQSFVSQLLSQKKRLPSPERTDIYKKIEKFLKLPKGDLSKLADLQRTSELKQKFEHPSEPLFAEIREVVLRKCKPAKHLLLRPIFEKEGFGVIERIVTQKLLDVAKGVAKEERKNEHWVRHITRLNNKTYAQMRVILLEFLEAEIFTLSLQSCRYLLEPLISQWDIDLTTFEMEIMVNPGLSGKRVRKFAFVEIAHDVDEEGLRDFLRNKSLSGDITNAEIEYLKKLRFEEKRPTVLYYYRELQSLRDPLHFRPPSTRKNS